MLFPVSETIPNRLQNMEKVEIVSAKTLAHSLSQSAKRFLQFDGKTENSFCL